MKTISFSSSNPWGIFVTTTGDIYIDNGYLHGRVDKWTIDTNSSVPAMYVGSACYGLFVDVNDILYCSMTYLHQVVTKPLNSNSNITAIVAGMGCPGSNAYMLEFPYGIFVDINFDLYVADCNNNRIQLFPSGQLGATTAAGNSSSNTTIILNCPTGIVLDGDNNLFIVDHNNNRIVGSGPNGFKCLVGCSGSYGSASNQLYSPCSLSFDSYGNMFVTDYSNSRIQKFLLSSNACGKYMKIFYLKEDFIDFLF
jgi:hypothetical protein